MTDLTYTKTYTPVTVFRFRPKDPGSALTHLIGFVAAIFATPPLLIHAAMFGASFIKLVSLSVFMISMILLYGARTIYHSFDVSERANRILRKIDHMMIFILIAGSYTPVYIIAISGKTGSRLLALVWDIALVGLILKACWITYPKWFSSLIYIGMGWVCVLALPQILHNLPGAAFAWLLVGGIIYTVGGVTYAMKFPVFHDRFKNFGCHELFHVFVIHQPSDTSVRKNFHIQENAGSGNGLPYTKNILENNTLVASIHMSDIFHGKAGVQTAIYVFNIGVPHDTKQLVKFIDFSNDGYTRQNKKKSSQEVNLRNTDHASERYNEIVNLVLYGKSYLKYFSEEEYIEDTISLNGDDWTLTQHKPNADFPSQVDFKNTVKEFLNWKVDCILREENNQ